MAPEPRPLPNSFYLRPLVAADLEPTVTLDRAALGGLWTLDGYRRELDSPCSDLLGLFGGDGSPGGAAVPIGIGCQWAILDEAHITLLAIHPDHQGQGLGQSLLWGLLEAAHRRRMARATLEVRTTNRIARSLYEKFGFRQAGIRKNYYAATGEDAAILWRSGLDHPAFPAQLQDWKGRARDRATAAGWHWQESVPLAATSPSHALD
jgi:ribosomal-protein-alanine N-acetyltransferase